MPEAAIAAPPPQPVASPTPAAPAPSAAPPKQSAGNDAFSSLDNYLTESESETPDTAPEKPAAKPIVKDKKSPLSKPEPDEGEDDVSDDEPEVKVQDENAKLDDKKIAKEIPLEKMAPKQLREAHSALKNKVAEYDKRIASYEKQLAEAKAGNSDEAGKKAFQDKLAAAEKRAADLEEEMRYVNFEKHPDFADKYEKPYNRAWTMGRQTVSQMKIALADGTTRPGTADDWDNLMKLRVADPDRAAEMVGEMFGNRAGAVTPYMQRVDEALVDMNEARQEWKTKGGEREKQRTEKSKAHMENVTKEVGGLWNKNFNEAVEKYPQWSKPIEGDTKHNELLEKGYSFAKDAFKQFDVMNERLAPEERADLVKKHTALFNKAAWFDSVAYKEAAGRREIKALKAKLADFEKSVPGNPQGRRGEAPAEDSWQNRIMKLQK